MGIEFGKKPSKIEKEIWERTKIEDTFKPEIMWKEFKDMSPFAQTEWIRKNASLATKMFWYLQEKYEGKYAYRYI